ncbi:MAG: metallopeptidase family protein [Oscillospiraceae bacterium]|nr:metallopeptidase family protein [Oscillospiraceae bacterium]
MFSIDDVNEILDEVASDFPEEIFAELNGGVSLVPDVKYNDADPNGGLYTLGEYRRDQMGRYIVLYFGSIRAVHGGDSRPQLRDNLKKLLAHELTHHLESLAGERDLEIEDERRMREYLR